MAQYRVLASEGRQRYIYTKTHKNIKEKKKIINETCYMAIQQHHSMLHIDIEYNVCLPIPKITPYYQN
jgi:hypothetical protein